MTYQDRTDEDLLRIIRKAETAKLNWLETHSRGPKKRPDHNILDQREYAEAFNQICGKLERSISRSREQRNQSGACE